MRIARDAFLRLKHSRLARHFEAPLLEDYARTPLPRVIWTYWDQGLEAAPPLVRRCIASWQACNPGWQVRVLDGATLAGVIDTGGIRPDVTLTKKSNVVRLRLLERHGGVWADATTLCATPLDAWLPMLIPQGYFAFQRPTRERAIATWFMASLPGATLTRTYRAAYEDYLARHGERYTFGFQYTFEYLCRTDRRFARLWAAVPAVSAGPSLAIERWLRDPERFPRPPVAEAARAVPVHKLSWKTAMPEAALAPFLPMRGGGVCHSEPGLRALRTRGVR